jgi:hypothetical protein
MEVNNSIPNKTLNFIDIKLGIKVINSQLVNWILKYSFIKH